VRVGGMEDDRGKSGLMEEGGEEEADDGTREASCRGWGLPNPNIYQRNSFM
jgi:hypothetical protein